MVRISFFFAVLFVGFSVSAYGSEFRMADEQVISELDWYALEVFERHDEDYGAAPPNTELVGAIFERNGQLDSLPMQIVDANRPWRIKIPIGGRFLALLHTHPANTEQEGFSGGRDGDVGLFLRRGHPQASYVRLPSGRVRKLTPRMARVATGRSVPGIPVCGSDQPCLPSLAELRLQYAEK